MHKCKCNYFEWLQDVKGRYKYHTSFFHKFSIFIYVLSVEYKRRHLKKMCWSLFNLIMIVFFYGLSSGCKSTIKVSHKFLLRIIFILYISSEAERELCVRNMPNFVLGISCFWIILLSQISMKCFTELVWCYMYNSIHYNSLLLTLFLLLIRGNNYKEIYLHIPI